MDTELLGIGHPGRPQANRHRVAGREDNRGRAGCPGNRTLMGSNKGAAVPGFSVPGGGLDLAEILNQHGLAWRSPREGGHEKTSLMPKRRCRGGLRCAPQAGTVFRRGVAAPVADSWNILFHPFSRRRLERSRNGRTWGPAASPPSTDGFGYPPSLPADTRYPPFVRIPWQQEGSGHACGAASRPSDGLALGRTGQGQLVL